MSAAGPHAAAIEQLFWVYVVVLTVVTLAVLTTITVAIWRRRVRTKRLEPPALAADQISEQPLARELRTLDPRCEKQHQRGVIVSTVFTVVALFVLLSESISTTNALEALDASEPIHVQVTGKQWWWQVRYLDADPANVFTTANELHVPVGRNVRLKLSAADVIHSFWAPSLNGKRDLIPGHENNLVFRADKPGRYRTQCAEFCGAEHALMAMWIVAEPRAQFEAWRTHQRTGAREPQTELEREGRGVFLGKQCATCHAIAGTPAQSSFGPDLTHLASRIELAAGTYPNRRGYLAGWVLGAQAMKPYAHMPNLELEPHELHALLAYLESLQ